MTGQEQDPFARFRVGSQPQDPFAQFRVGQDNITPVAPQIEEPVEQIEQPPEEDKSWWNYLTTSLLPDLPKKKLVSGEGTHPHLQTARFAEELGRGAYSDIIQPTFSAAGVATSVLGGPLVRGVLGAAAKVAPTATKAIGRLLNTEVVAGEAPTAIKKIVEQFSPKSSGVTPSVDTVPESAPVKPKLRANTDGTFSPIDRPSIKLDQAGKELPGPIDRLISSLDEAAQKEAQQKKIYSSERSERIGEVEKVTTPGLKGHWERKSKLAGEHTKVAMEPLDLNENDINALINDITSSGLRPYQAINAGDGLEKILTGKVPKASEISLLRKVFGEEKISELASKLPKIDKRGNLLHELLNVPRALQSSYDLSFPFRQGKGLIYSKDWRNAWGSMAKSLGSEEAYKAVMADIMKRTNYQTIISADGTKQVPFFQKAGLHLTDLLDMTSREEEMVSSLAEKIPFKIGAGVRASNRAYTAFANKLRADHFDRLVNSAEAAGLKPRENLELAQNIASFVNNATGRGDLPGGLERHAAALNTLFFSPRFMASRLQMLNPANYMKNIHTPEGRFVAKQYTKSALALASTWLAETQLARMAGAEVSDDTTSTDFGKIKMGNTRLDPPAGFQQWLVLADRIRTGEYTTVGGNEREYGVSFGSKTRFDAAMDFIVNKLAPVPALGARALRASEHIPFDVADESLRLFAPMLLANISEILQEDPKLLPLIIPAAVGYGVDVQGDRGGDSKLLGPWQESFEYELPRVNEGESRFTGRR